MRIPEFNKCAYIFTAVTVLCLVFSQMGVFNHVRNKAYEYQSTFPGFSKQTKAPTKLPFAKDINDLIELSYNKISALEDVASKKISNISASLKNSNTNTQLENTASQGPPPVVVSTVNTMTLAEDLLPPKEPEPGSGGRGGSAAKYLIYRCDINQTCGGWADRVKGVLMGFIIAAVTDRVFKSEIQMESCDVTNFFVPNKYNWSHPIPFHETVHGKQASAKLDNETGYANLIDNMRFYNTINTTDFHKMVEKKRIMYFSANLEYIEQLKTTTVYPAHPLIKWMRKYSRDVVYATLYNTLFKPTTMMQRRLAGFLASLREASDNLVCAHIRMGRNPSIPNDSVIRQTPEELPGIWDFLSNLTKPEKSKLFLMSDSSDVIASAQNQTFSSKMVVTPGPVLHINNNRVVKAGEKCQGLEKVVFDQSVLSHCDTLMISKSGLSRHAAYLRGRDEGLHCLMPGGDVVACQRATLKELYGVKG